MIPIFSGNRAGKKDKPWESGEWGPRGFPTFPRFLFRIAPPLRPMSSNCNTLTSELYQLTSTLHEVRSSILVNLVHRALIISTLSHRVHHPTLSFHSLSAIPGSVEEGIGLGKSCAWRNLSQEGRFRRVRHCPSSNFFVGSVWKLPHSCRDMSDQSIVSFLCAFCGCLLFIVLKGYYRSTRSRQA